MDLYHVTYLLRLGGIQSEGLAPGSGQTFSRGYAGHARGRVFLTEWDGVDFWVQRYNELAHHHTDHPEQGWLPVVLVVDASELDLRPDEAGSSDARASAYFVTDPIAAEQLGVYDGDEWVDLDEADPEDMLERALDAADVEHLDDATIYWLDEDFFLPEEPA